MWGFSCFFFTLLATSFLLAFFLGSPAAIRCLAQATTGTILGSVTDSSGAQLPKSSVQAINTLTGSVQTITADAEGNYIFSALPVGEYRIEAEAPGFKRFIHAGIILDVNRNARVDVVLA